MTTQPTAFVRKASGLRRDVTFLDVVGVQLANLNGGAALGTIGFTTVLLSTMSGVNLVYATILAWILSIPQVIVYTMMTTRVSRTGGDYVWVSRIYGGFFGGALSLMGYTLQAFAYIGLLLLATVSAIGSVGVALGYSNMLQLALPGNVPGANVLAQALVAIVLFVAFIALNWLSPSKAFKFCSIGIIIAIIATFVGISSLLAAGTAGVQNYMSYLNSIGANTTYTQVASSYTGPTFDLAASAMLLPFFGIFVFPWMNAGPAVASEIKGKSALRYNVLTSSVVTLVIVLVAFATMYYVGGLNFINGAFANSNLVYNWGFNFFTLAMGVSNNLAVSWFIGLGWILWYVCSSVTIIVVMSRYIFALSFDRFLPEKISYVSPKYHSPTIALLIILVWTVILTVLCSFFYGTFVALYGASVGPMIWFLFVGLAALIYALRKEKGLPKVVLATAGLLMAIVFAYIVYEFLAYPAIWGGSVLGYGYEVCAFIAGMIIYAISKSYYGKRGIDITLAFKEIPPL